MAAGERVVDAVSLLLADGYSSIKIKVGRQDLEQDIETVKALRELVGSRATLRLDANQAWSRKEALQFGYAIGPDRIDYIEEPTHDPADHALFFEETGLAVGLDESLVDLDPDDLDGLTGVAALVLKPALLGSIPHCLAFIMAAEARGINVVLSSLFESPQALRFYAQWAVQCQFADVPQGLDTWRWMPGAEDELTVREGALHL
jgi:O-succinylbenzoate synthase